MTHPNFPYKNDPEDLVDYLIIMMNDTKAWKTDEKKIKEAMLKIIKECKSEWCKRQRDICANIYANCTMEEHFSSITETAICNAPEPECTKNDEL